MRDMLRGERVHQKIWEHRRQRSPGRSPGAPGLNCLVLGGGGREYAIAWRLANCASVTTIDITPGNAGMSLFTRLVDFRPDDVGRLEEHIVASHIDLAVVGTDELIAAGIGDVLRRSGIAVVGASREASRVEWSKRYAKELMDEAGVPTARWEAFADAAAAREALDRWGGPVVVKADGLALGKGVVVARSADDAREALGSPPISGGPVLLEELLEGDEASLQALVDGETVVALPPARDHKRVGDGDTGPNTGGMGAFSPTAVLPDHEAQPVADALIAPIARTLRKRGVDYRGVLYAGLIRTDRGWRVLEYNARFGDPEAEVTLPRIEGDFARLLVALGEGKLAAYVAENPVRFSDRAFVDVVLCAENYPGTPKTGMRIDGLDRLPEGVFSFHGATRRDPTGGTVVSGGRAIHIVGTGANLSEARDRAYLGAERVSFEGKFYRSDIARQEVAVA
ncbi:MAG: phosphoribosylamine--glycine ligase [Chloroflexi bacterium]|nr:MAG: phosphoribosylamine--glycine ligase [Chloroflexota bacterium]